MTSYQKAVNEWLTNQALSHDSSVLQASFELPNYLSGVMQRLTPQLSKDLNGLRSKITCQLK